LPYIIICVFLLLCSASAAGSFSMKLDTDAYVDADDANSTFSDGDTLWVTSDGGEPVQEAYIGFVNNFGTAGVFSPEEIKSATLKIYATDVKEPGEVTAYFMHGATMSEVSWSDKPEYDETTSVSVDVDQDGEYTLDATDIIKKAIETCAEGCPFSVVLVADDSTSVGFASSEGSDENKPVLEYTTAA